MEGARQLQAVETEGDGRLQTGIKRCRQHQAGMKGACRLQAGMGIWAAPGVSV